MERKHEKKIPTKNDDVPGAGLSPTHSLSLWPASFRRRFPRRILMGHLLIDDTMIMPILAEPVWLRCQRTDASTVSQSAEVRDYDEYDESSRIVNAPCGTR